ncbi:MAG: AAA family ATPase [Deferrisomatales bacterium]|nr:AAA family ATPase [Deferrisomatales bacterium]
MKITEHTKKKGGRRYWTIQAESMEEDTAMGANMALLLSKWKKGEYRAWYTYDAQAALAIRNGWNCETSEEDEPVDDWRETRTALEHGDTVSAVDLRKAASARARELEPDRPRTAMSQTWSRDELAAYVLDGTAPAGAPAAAPAPVKMIPAGTVSEPAWAPAAPPAVTTATPAAPPALGDLGAMLAALVEPYVKGAVDAETVRAIVREEAGIAPHRFEVVLPTGAVHAAGMQHAQFPKLVRRLGAGLHVMLVGSPGTGKTHACHAAASALGLSFHTTSVGAQTTKSDLLGFIDAHSKLVRTQFREAYEHGGVFLLDEIDAGNPNVLTVLNAALANGCCPFPDGMVDRHADFRGVAAANTYGRGGDRLFVGRNQLDAASLDRFVVLDWDVDERLETALTGNNDWCTYVQRMRKAAGSVRAQVVISPRASINGAKILASGDTWEEAEAEALWKGIPAELREQIKRAA